MKNKLNFKIVGSGPTGLLLSIALSKFDCNIFLTDLLTKDRLIDKDKTYAITHSTRKILSKFRLWEKLEPFLFGFDTLSISDSVTSAFTNLSTSDLDDDISSVGNIGWVVKHSDLMNIFFLEIDYHSNIFFKSTKNLSQEKFIFDYKFISTGAYPINKKSFNFLYFRKKYNQSCLTFKVLLRGNVESCAYEIFREEGPLALLPLDKNLYQIIWTSSTSKSIDRLNTDKNFLMDNLSTILPDYFKLDQIVGEVNLFPVSLSINLSIFNSKKLLFVGDSFHTFHPVGGQGLNTCWRDVNNIFDILNENSFVSNHNLKYLKSNAKKKNSLIETAYDNKVPIFCPAFTDSSAGFGLVMHQEKNPKKHITIDSIREFRELTEIKIRSKGSGLFMIGGGVPKNFIQDTVICAELLGKEVDMHKYAIQITVADSRDGACSSSTLKEASSWGKVDVTKEQMVFAEATSVLPLIASDAYHKGEWKNRSRKNFSKIFG